jgi:putative two-component system response regulator
VEEGNLTVSQEIDMSGSVEPAGKEPKKKLSAASGPRPEASAIRTTGVSGKRIMVVEDSRAQAEKLTEILRKEGYSVTVARDGLEALYMLTESPPDLIVSDVWMPNMNGYELCRAVKGDSAMRHIPLVLLTSMSGFSDIVKGLNAGADYYLTKPYSESLLLSMVRTTLEKSGKTNGNGNGNRHPGEETVLSTGISSDQLLNFLFSTYENVLQQNRDLSQTKKELASLNKELEGRVREKTASINRALDGTVVALSTLLEIRDPYTAGHQSRVSLLSHAIGREVRLTEEQCEGIKVSGLLHDIGKVIVPTEILCKPSKLTEYEFGFIKAHPETGYNILRGIDFPWPVAHAVLEHHERIDGSGYPAGLGERDIIMEAKILAVADVVESMASHRPYRPALGIEEALQEISAKRGILYSADIVDAALELFRSKRFSFEYKKRTE